MKNEEILRELAKAAIDSGSDRLDYTLGENAANNIVRAVLSRLAEIGMSEEMREAYFEGAGDFADSGGFTAAISYLAGGA